MNDILLDVRELSVSFHTDDGVFQAVDTVSLHVNSGEIVGLVGESGCGKSVTSLSILRLVPAPPGKIDAGQIFFKGHDLLKLGSEKLRQIRGKSISMIFQEPLSALDPGFWASPELMILNQSYLNHQCQNMTHLMLFCSIEKIYQTEYIIAAIRQSPVFSPVY